MLFRRILALSGVFQVCVDFHLSGFFLGLLDPDCKYPLVGRSTRLVRSSQSWAYLVGSAADVTSPSPCQRMAARKAAWSAGSVKPSMPRANAETSGRVRLAERSPRQTPGYRATRSVGSYSMTFSLHDLEKDATASDRGRRGSRSTSERHSKPSDSVGQFQGKVFGRKA